MNKTQVNPQELFDGSAFGMSQAIVEERSGLIFISGQVDWNHQMEVTSSTVDGQLRNALNNLSVVLRESGSSIEELLSVRVFVRGEIGDHLETMAPIMAEYLGSSRPAMTGLGVASLASPETLVEVEAVAKRAESNKKTTASQA